MMSELDATLARYLEESLTSLPWLGIDVPGIIRNLAGEIVASTRQDSDNNRYAPDQFTLTACPGSSSDIRKGLGLVQSQISLQMEEALATLGYRLTHPVHVTFASDPTLRIGVVRVIAWHSRDPLQLTDQMQEYEEPGTSTPPRGAFLIVSGKRNFPLRNKRVRIGRRLDNDLVLDDNHVSRQHAELIAREGYYILRDMNSTAGTRVNKTLIKEHRLEPGDLIHIASIEIIYNEDPLGPPTETPPYKPASSADSSRDRSTPMGMRTIHDLETRALKEDSPSKAS